MEQLMSCSYSVTAQMCRSWQRSILNYKWCFSLGCRSCTCRGGQNLWRTMQSEYRRGLRFPAASRTDALRYSFVWESCFSGHTCSLFLVSSSPRQHICDPHQPPRTPVIQHGGSSSEAAPRVQSLGGAPHPQLRFGAQQERARRHILAALDLLCICQTGT